MSTGEHAEEFEEAPRDDSTFPDPIPGEGDPVATGTKGSGEWPSRNAPPRGPAPGTVPERAEEIAAGRQENVAIDTELKDRLDGNETAGTSTLPPGERDRLLGRDATDDNASDEPADPRS
ncbi:MAG TPA: hypothetical protein VM345_15090 [Acidimicrobiales bacterium]|jgi:hypothetical protein|nr:hypothetical protein [Acidimicrobiales bacterium]